VFALGIRPPQRKVAIITGAFSWAAVGLDEPGHRRDRTWMDLNISRERAEELLKHRSTRSARIRNSKAEPRLRKAGSWPRTFWLAWPVSSLIALHSQLGAVIANPGQGHGLVAGWTQLPGPAVLPIVTAAATRLTTSLDTCLAGTQGLHLFFGGKLRSAKDGAVSPFEMAAIRIMPQPRLGSCGRAIEVHGIDHVSNVWMFHGARHRNTLRASTLRTYRSRSNWPAERPHLPH
jgi:hypothetical protein